MCFLDSAPKLEEKRLPVNKLILDVAKHDLTVL